MAQRKRNETISIRVYKKEKEEILSKARKAKQSVTSLILNAVQGAVIATQEMVDEWVKVNKKLGDIYLLLQDIDDKLDVSDKAYAEIHNEIIKQGKELNEVWQYLKLLIASQKTTRD